jgi:hypothetical protein
MTPTARTLTALRRAGYVAAVVEKWIAQAGIRKDLFGCIDLVAVRRDEAGVLGVQATTLSNVSTRVEKAKGQAELRTWLAAGNRFEVWGWAQRSGRWTVKRVAVKGEDLQAEVIVKPRRRGKRMEQGELFA